VTVPIEITVDHPRWGGMVFDALAAGPADGEPVLLLHGFPQTARCWRHQLAALADAGRRAVALTQRGYSPRARPPEVGAYAMADLVGDVLAVAGALGWDRFDLVGHDWGGAVAWQVAGRHPERVRALAVLSTPHPRAFAQASEDPGGDQRRRSFYIDLFRAEGSEAGMLANDGAGLRLIFAGSGMTEEEAHPYLQALSTEEALRAALHWYRAARLTDVEGLGPIVAPTLYVWSTEDPALGPEAAEATAAAVEGPYRFVVLEGVDHWVPEHAADRVSELLVEHLGGAGGGRHPLTAGP
jgi:pimeloyl-ACP methyl ester carboxylesterase